MKPLIGVTPSMEISQVKYSVMNDNVKAILHAGGIPIMLPYLSADEDIERIADEMDGLYATGGDDIDPTLFGEEPHPRLGIIIPDRDQFEIALTKKMLELRKPVLGVCRGAQILNIAAGGDMYQDIYTQMDEDLLQHSQKAPRGYGSHYIDVLKDSLLHKLTGTEKLRVNSYHHQANRSVSPEFQISGYASDGVVEAVESKGHPFALGVQWHPEAMASDGDASSLNIYQGFVAACSK